MPDNEIFTEPPFTEFAEERNGARSDNYGYLNDREQEILERLIDFIRVTEIRNLGYPLGTHHAALGGKNFGHCLMIKYLIFGGPERVENVKIVLPSTKMLGSAVYFTFLHHNPRLQELLRAKHRAQAFSRSDYAEIRQAFREAALPEIIDEELLVLLHKTQHDFYILRSSASCEDGKLPSAGLFDSLFYYDDRKGRTIHQRLALLGEVLKQVWASLFNPAAIAMMQRCGLNPLNESMGITFQPVIGDWYGDYFFPLISGVVKSTNTWPWGEDIRRDDPVGRIGFGMGTFMVGETGSYPEGGPRVFSIRRDGALAQLLGDYLDPETTYATGGRPIARNDAPDNGQTRIDVLTVEPDGTAAIRTLDFHFDHRRPGNAQGVAAQIPHGYRRILATHRRATDWRTGESASFEVFDAIGLPMAVRRGHFFDLGRVLRRIMDDLGAETRQSVSMEFAVRPVETEEPDAAGRKGRRTSFEFHLLQVRPQTTMAADQPIALTKLRPGHHVLLARSESAFGHLEAVVGCTAVLTNELIERLGKERARALLRELDRLHRGLYLLVGPDAEEFVMGSSGFESLYSGLSPRAVISIKTLAGIRSLAGYSGSHAADNIERAPVIIQASDRLEPGLQELIRQVGQRLESPGRAASPGDLLAHREVHVELDGNTGNGQVFSLAGA